MTRYLLDCFYYPNWIQDSLLMDVQEVYDQLQAIPLADRAAAHMKYRGHQLARSKFFFVDSMEQVPVYRYPGFQFESIVQEYQPIAAAPMIEKICGVLEEQFDHKLNHVIGTAYKNEKDNIGWHDDKPDTIHPDVPIYILSFGAQRPLSFRRKPTDEEDVTPAVEVEIPMESGSLFVLGHATNRAYQHAILPSAVPLDKRFSLVCRNIANVMPYAEIQKKVEQTRKRAAAVVELAEEKENEERSKKTKLDP